MALGIIVLVAGCASASRPAGNTTAGPPRAASPAAPVSARPAVRPGGLSARLVLRSAAVVAGSSVTARVVIDNETGHPVNFADCDGGAYEVVLWAGGYRPGAAWPACLGHDTLPAGESTRVVRFMAAYGSCAPQRPVPPGARACLPDGGIPPLPPGTYRAVTFPADPGMLPVPAPVTVRLVAAVP